MAIGIAVSGVGIGGMVFPPLFVFFFEEYGLNSSFFLMAAIFAHLFLTAAVFRTPSKQPQQPPVSHSPPQDSPSLPEGRLGQYFTSNI